MEIIHTELPEVKIFKVNVYKDPRGFFMESFNKKLVHDTGILEDFVQDNISLSQKGTIRGLHFQNPPHAQGKLVRVLQGAILDVAVDIRKNSKTYGKYVSQILSADNFLAMWIPVGFAHGFHALEDNSMVFYKTTNYYNKPAEQSIRWNDPDININWQLNGEPILSERDTQATFLKYFESTFRI